MKSTDPTPEDAGKMSLSGHLTELRRRLIVWGAVFLAAMVLCLTLAPRIVTLLNDLGRQYGYRFVYLAPQELVTLYVTLALVGGVVLSLPVLAYEIYAFSRPGLRAGESRFFGAAMVFGTLSFVLGVLFAWFVTVPFMLHFLIQFSYAVEIEAAIRAQEYVGFLLTVFIIFGLIFELPVISVLLTRLGILKPEILVKSRKVMVVVIFLVAALITPPDVTSQIMVAIPILLLYELSIALSRLAYRRKRSESEEEK
ncbi:MAG: twin-arginine translocase subunit TatC [bacterium]